MVPFLVLVTFAVLILVQVYLQSQRKRASETARAQTIAISSDDISAGMPSPDFLFHPGHSWVYVHDSGLASVGTTDFAANFTGLLSKVKLPKEGAHIRQGESAWTLVSERERLLDQVMPIDGKVVAVNREVLEDPTLAQRSPYENGWLLRVRPRDLPSSIRNLLPGTAAKTWIDTIRDRIAAQLSSGLGVLAHDGGEWTTGFGDRLEDTEWENLKEEFFSASGTFKI